MKLTDEREKIELGVILLNVAILYANESSQRLKHFIEKFINPTLEVVGKVKINVAAYVGGGGGVM